MVLTNNTTQSEGKDKKGDRFTTESEIMAYVTQSGRLVADYWYSVAVE